MLSHSPSLYFPQWPTVAHICYYLHSLAIILGVQCPNSSVIDTGLKVLSSWFALQASNIQQKPPPTQPTSNPSTTPPPPTELINLEFPNSDDKDNMPPPG